MGSRLIDLSGMVEETEEEAAEIEKEAERPRKRLIDLSGMVEAAPPKKRETTISLEGMVPKPGTGRKIDLSGMTDAPDTTTPTMGPAPKETEPEWKRLGYASEEAWKQTPKLSVQPAGTVPENAQGWIGARGPEEDLEGAGGPDLGPFSFLMGDFRGMPEKLRDKRLLAQREVAGARAKGLMSGSARTMRSDAEYDPTYDTSEIEAVVGERAARAVRSMVTGEDFGGEQGEYEAALDDLDRALENIDLLEQGLTEAHWGKTGFGAGIKTKPTPSTKKEIKVLREKLEKWKAAEKKFASPKIHTGETANGDEMRFYKERIMDDVPIGTHSAAQIVQYVSRLDEHYTREQPGEMLVLDPSGIGGKYAGTEPTDYRTWTADPSQTPRTVEEEYWAWKQGIDADAAAYSPSLEEMERSIDVLEGQISDYSEYGLIKDLQWTIRHPYREEDKQLSDMRIRQLTGMRDILLTSLDKMRKGTLQEGGNGIAINAALQLGESGSKGVETTMTRDPETGIIRWDQRTAMDPLAKLGFWGKMQEEGPGQLAANLYVESVKMAGMLPNLVTLALDSPFWIARNAGKSFNNAVLAYTGDDPADTTNMSLISGAMNEKGVHPLRDSDLRKLAKYSGRQLLAGEADTGRLSDSQVLAYIESREELPEIRKKVREANNKLETTWSAPVEATFRMGREIRAEWRESVGMGYFFDNPFDFLTLLSAGAGAVGKVGSGLARMAPRAHSLLIDSATAVASPATKWQKMLSAVGIQRTPIEVQRYTAAQRALQKEAAFLEAAAESTMPGFREAAGLAEGEVLMGGRAHTILKQQTVTLGEVGEAGAKGLKQRGLKGHRVPYEGPGRTTKAPVSEGGWVGKKPSQPTIDKMLRETGVGPHSDLLWKMNPEAVKNASKLIMRAKRIGRISDKLQNADPILAVMRLPGFLAKRSTNPSVQEFLLRPSERRKVFLTIKTEAGTQRVTMQDWLTTNEAAFQIQMGIVNKKFQSLPTNEKEIMAIHNMLRAATEKGELVAEHMYVARLKNPADGDAPPELDPLTLPEAEIKAYENMKPSEIEELLASQAEAAQAGLREAKAGEKVTLQIAGDRMRGARDHFRPTGEIDFTSKTSKVLPKGSKGDVLAHLHHRLEHHPAYLDEIATIADDLRILDEQVDMALLLRDDLRLTKAPKEARATATKKYNRLKKALAKKEKQLRDRGAALIKKTKEVKSVMSGLADHLSVLGKSTEIPTKGMPSLAAMTMRMMKGKPISTVPAHHVVLAKTIGELRIQRAMLSKEKWAALKMQFGGDTFTADTILKQFDNFNSTKRYLDLLDAEFTIGNLSSKKGYKIDVIYKDSLPMGIDALDIGQMGATARHTRSLRKLLMYGGMDSVGAELLTESTFWRNLENYAPDFYRQYAAEFGKAAVTEEMFKESMAFMLRNGYNGDRYRKAVNKAMFNVTERESLGLITDPRYYVAKGMYQIIGDIRFKRFAESIKHATLENGAVVISDVKLPGYKQAGQTVFGKSKNANRWLDLKDKWIHPDMYQYLKRSRNLDTNDFVYWYNEQLMRRWKFGMTVLNPTTHLRNTFSNLIMSEMAGLNPFVSPSARQADLSKTIKEYLARDLDSIVIKEAMQGNLFGSTFADAELRSFLGDVSRGGERTKFGGKGRKSPRIPENMQELGWTMMDEYVWKTENGLRNLEMTPKNLRWIRDKAARAYIAEDEIFKLWRFKQIRILQKEFRTNGGIITKDMRRAFSNDNDRILSIVNHADDAKAIRVAAEDAHKWFFDYSDIPGWVDVVRKTAMPFFTYSYNAVPRVAKWMNRNPIKAYAWREMFDWINFTQEYMFGEPTVEDVYDTQKMRSRLPAYARMTSVVLPSSAGREFEMVKRGKRHGEPGQVMVGNARLAPAWDVQYWTQLGGLYRPSEAYEREGFLGFVEKYVQNPIVPTAMTFMNRPAWNMFGSQNLVHKDDGHLEAVARGAQQIMNIWAPSWATPGIPQSFRDGDKVYDMPAVVQAVGTGLAIGSPLLGRFGLSRAAFLGGIALLGGGRNQRKLWASITGTPDYMSSRNFQRMREFDEIAYDLLGAKYNWMYGDHDELAETQTKMLERAGADYTGQLGARPSREESLITKFPFYPTKESASEDYEERVRFINSYFNHSRATAERRAYYQARAIKKGW